MRRVVTWTIALIAVPSSLLVLLAVGLIDRYDGLSYRAHSAAIRAAIPWRLSRFAALLPVAVLVPGTLTASGWAMQILALGVGLLLCEVYSVCFHRESYIAAFEPRWIPQDAKPLGRAPVRPADRRLHYLLRVQVIYAVPLVAVSVILTGHATWASLVLLGAFVAKYVPSAWIDYEAYFHWDMHCKVLEMRDSPRLSKFWREVCEHFIGPIVGSAPHLYSIEHLVIHHPSNAGPRDIHSPLPYRRTSGIEFSIFMWKTIAILATGIGVIQNRRLTRSQRLSIIAGVVSTGAIVTVSIVYGVPLGYWLAAAVIYRGTNTAMAQYVWHGLHDGSGSSSPLATTILWLPSSLPVVDGAAEAQHPVDGFIDHVPNPGADWAFFDNYHLVHHLHPRAHFTEYPALLQKEMPRVSGFGSPVIRLAAYPTFFADLMANRMERIDENYISDLPAGARIQTLRERLEPWSGVRSRFSIASESGMGLRIDRGLAAVWRSTHRLT